MGAELGGAEREARVGRGGGHVGVRRGEGRLELMGEGAVAGRVMGVDGWGGKEPVGVVGGGADAQGHLVNYSAPLWVRQTITVLNQRGRGGQDGLAGVVSGSEGTGGLVGKQRVGRGHALGGGGRSVRRAAVRQVRKSVRVDRGGDEGVGPQGAVVAVPVLAAVVGQEELHLGQRTSRSLEVTRGHQGSLEVIRGHQGSPNPPVRIPASAAAPRSPSAAGAGGGRTPRGGRRRERRVVVPGGRSALWTGTRRPKLRHTKRGRRVEAPRSKRVIIIIAGTRTAPHKVGPLGTPSGFVPDQQISDRPAGATFANFNGGNAAAAFRRHATRDASTFLPIQTLRKSI